VRALIVLALVLVLALPAVAQFAVEFEVATVEVGMSSESQAIKKLGTGFLVERPDGGRVHVYSDAARTASMYLSADQYGLVEEVLVVEGLLRPYQSSMRCNLPPSMWKTRARIGLGASRRKILGTYGEPTEEADIGGLHWISYKSNYSKDRRVRLMYQASFGFKNDRLTRILLHNGN